MSSSGTTSNNDQRAFSYLVGVGVTHSIAPLMHDFVAKSLGYSWTFIAKECATVEDAIRLFREPTFAGGVVTMPYKVSIMPYLDGLDEQASMLRACNNVYRAADGSLRGTNTDWRGVKGCLESATTSGRCEEGRGKPALLIGAGGAARAALYVLHHELMCRPIYVVNRDRGEVAALLEDAKIYQRTGDVQIIHLDSVDRAIEVERAHGGPFYIVGTVPDFEPREPSELEARAIMEYFLKRTSENSGALTKGVLLDMCFKPRRTRTIKLAERYGWITVEGTGVIGHQIDEQYRLWCGRDRDYNKPVITEEIKRGAWEALNKAAVESTAINT